MMDHSRYGDSHKMLIQAMLSKPVSSEDDMLTLYDLITGHSSRSVEESGLPKMVDQVNSEVKKLYIEIKKQICEVTETTYYALVSHFQSPDEAFEKLIQTYSPAEREYFRMLVEEIITSEERCIMRHAALNLTVATGSQATQSLGPSANSRILEKFVSDGWFILTEENERFFLGARGVAELEHLLMKTYKVDPCTLCGRVCIMGLRCEEDSCDSVAHSHCLRIFAGKKQNANSCPKCRKEMRQI